MFSADWGILETLNLMSEGALPVEDASVLLYPQLQAGGVQARLGNERAVWITHSAGREEWHGVNAALEHTATSAGYSRELLHTVYDRNGRAIFDILRFRRL
jgi:hypothetical protein